MPPEQPVITSGTPLPPPGGGGAPAIAPPAVSMAPWAAQKDGVYMIGEGAAAKPWFDTITEQPVRDLMATKQYKNPSELAMAYHNLNKLQNGAGDVVSVPKADAPAEEWGKFYTKLGRPEAAEKYDLKFGDSVKADPGMVKFGKEMFFEMGASPQKAQAMADKWNAFVTETTAAKLKADQIQNDAEVTALTTKWGADGEKNKAAGVRAVKALGLSNELVGKIESHIGTSAILELLVALGGKSAEGGAFKDNGGNSGDPNNVDAMSKEQAAARIKELQGDKDFQAKLTNKKDPAQKEALALWEKLWAKGG